MWYRKAETTGRMHKGAPGKCLKWLIKSKHKTKVIITGLHQKKCVLCLVAQLCPTLCDPMDCSLPGSSVHGILQARYWKGLPCPPLGIFPTQGSYPGLPHCRQILYQLSHQGSLRILERVAYPLSSGSSRPRSQTEVSCITGEWFTSWVPRKTHIHL